MTAAEHTLPDIEALKEKLQKGDYSTDLLQNVLKVSERQRELIYSEGYECYQRDQFERAHECFSYVTLLNPFLQKHWVALGACDMCLQLWEIALRRFAVAAFLEPEDPYPDFYAYQCYQQLKDQTEAHRALEAAYQKACLTPRFESLLFEIERKR